MPIVLTPPSAEATVTGASADGGILQATSAAHKRIYHAGRGYTYADVAVTVGHRVDTTAPAGDYRAGVIARRRGAADYLTAYVSNGALFLRKSDGGVLSDLLASTAIAALTAGAEAWVRLICNGDTLRAEHWAGEPTPMGVAANVLTFTLSGAEATKFGAGVKGQAGIYWTPGAGYPNARITSFAAELFTYRSRTLPDKLTLGGSVPGDLPALCDLHVTHSGGAAAPVYVLAGWAPRKTPAVGTLVPFGVIEGEQSSANAFAGGRSYAGAQGELALYVTSSAAGTANAFWDLDGAAIANPGAEAVDVEVYARVGLSATMTRLSLVVSSTPWDGTGFGAERFSDRGRAGLSPIMPSTGFAWRPVRLGRLTIPAGRSKLALTATWTGAASSDLVIDHLFLLPAKAHVSSPRSLAPDVSYPKFFPSTAQITRVARFDGTGLIAKPPAAPVAEHGLGGRIEIGPGNMDLAVWLASMVPGDPTASTASVQLSHAATVRASLLPRFHYG